MILSKPLVIAFTTNIFGTCVWILDGSFILSTLPPVSFTHYPYIIR